MFPNFNDFARTVAASAESRRLRLCIATPDFVKLQRNGGIGTSFYHTARLMAERGIDVTVLYCAPLPDYSASRKAEIVSDFLREGIKVETLDYVSFAGLWPGDYFTALAYQTYRHLKDSDYDVIVFADWRGVGYHCLNAKRLGQAFHNTALWVQTHSTSLWHALNDEVEGFSDVDMRVFQLERGSVAAADLVVSPTQYLLDWKSRFGFDFPADTYVQPYLLAYPDPPQQVVPVGGIDELVFFGRLEKRKGLHLFVNAVKRLAALPAMRERGIKITFLGKQTKVDGMLSLDYIQRHLGNSPFEVNVVTLMGHDEAVSYLTRRNCVAFMCSTADNSPLTVHEALHNGIPFAASNAGGIPELVREDDIDKVLFDLNPEAIKTMMVRIIKDGHWRVPPRVVQSADNIEVWHQALIRAAAQARQVTHRASARRPLVTLAIPHYNRPHYLSQALASVAAQTYPHIEVVVVDDGSDQDEAVAYLRQLEQNNPTRFPLTVLRQPNLFPGAARNRALAEAKGEYVVYVDDDNHVMPDMVERFVVAAETSGDAVVTCFVNIFPEHGTPGRDGQQTMTYTPLGGSVSACLFGNHFGDTNAIYRTEVLRGIGGFTEDYGIACEDYELFAKLAMDGHRIGVIPEALMWKRVTAGSVHNSSSMVSGYYRATRPLLAGLDWRRFGDAVLLSVGMGIRSLLGPGSASPPVSPSQARMARSVDSGIAGTRNMVQRLLETGATAQVTQTLWLTATETTTGRALAWDWACEAIRTGTVRQALGRLAGQSLDGNGDLAAARALLEWAAGGDIEGLIQVLSELADDPTAHYEYRLYLGRALVKAGRLAEGIAHLARSLDPVNHAYVARDPALVDRVARGTLSSGIFHYLLIGQTEGRRLDYQAAHLNPFATGQAEAVADYLPRIRNAVGRQAGVWEILDWPTMTRMFAEAVESNAALHLYDLANRFVVDGDRVYFRHYPDLAAAGPAAWGGGLDHYLARGRAEGRHYPLDALERALGSNGDR